MKRFSLLPLLFLTLAMVACSKSNRLSMTDFTIETYTPAYAAGFDLRGTAHGASTLLTVRNPWQGATEVHQHVFLARNNEKAPEGFEGQTVEVPVRHVVCMSSSHVAMLDALGEVRRITGVSGIDYISNPYISEHKFCGEVRDVGYDTNLNFELLVALHPDVILLYGVTGENAALMGKLQELGIPYIYVGDYVEESPLGKAEWLVALAELCNRADHGRHVFDDICRRYETVKATASKSGTLRPRIMLNTPYRDTWFMPSVHSYMVRLVADAGGEYVYPQNESTASVPIDLEEAYLLAQGADLWLNVGFFNTLDELKAQNPKFANAPAVRQGRVYNNNRRRTPAGGSDFWESGVVCPDKVLGDLIRIVQGKDTDLHYYHRLP